MPTTLEIKYPELQYCQHYDIHCPCPKCSSPCAQVPNDINCQECHGEGSPSWHILEKDIRDMELDEEERIIAKKLHQENIWICSGHAVCRED